MCNNYSCNVIKINAKMGSDLNLIENRFLKNYYALLAHHMNCILESRMMLDEDLHLILTFWSPTSSSRTIPIYSTTACALSAVCGLIIAVRMQKMYPLYAALTPAVFQASHKATVLYFTRKYKNNCENLLSSLAELHQFNRDVVEYSQRAHLTVLKIPENGLVLLKNTRRDFIKSTLVTLMEILKRLIVNMRKINQFVPITEGEYMYAAEWNLDHYVPADSTAFNEVLHKFEDLSDLAVLIVSNFLGCLGLSLCVQLWKDNARDFKRVFDEVIPQLCDFVNVSLCSSKAQFRSIRYTLSEGVNYKREAKRKHKIELDGPLDDFLLNTRAVYEMSAELQQSLHERRDNINDLLPLIDDVNLQFTLCSDSLNNILKLVRVVTRRANIDADSVGVIPSVDSFSIEVRHDDPETPLEDEEYNLSLHGSDDDDEDITPFIDYADQCSSENLEMMLVELKRKLDERKSNTKHEKTVTPPPPRIPCLPNVNNVNNDFLEAVRNVARNLNREEEFQFGFNMFPEIPRPFNTPYHCFSVAMLPGNERQDVERGGKIIMPPSALEQLTRLNINYPMLFKIVNKKTNRTSHCGVLEFVADEGKVYLPLWMMHNLVLDEGDLIQIESVSLAVGTFAKFQPLSPEFLDITNPKAVLENCLRTFACLTTGDVISVKYNQRSYELCVLETQPGDAISIIECDMNVEFAAPIGYKEEDNSKPKEEDMAVDPADLMPEPSGFVAFKGTGNRLDGKKRKDSATLDMPTQKPIYVRGIPDYDYQIGTLRFLRNFVKSQAQTLTEENPEFKAFSGKGFSLKRAI